MALALLLSIALNLGMWLHFRSGASPQTPKAILDYWPPPTFGNEPAKDADAFRESGDTATRRIVDSPYETSADFAKYAEKLREQALTKVQPQMFAPTTSQRGPHRKFPVKANIITTVFWVGEKSNYKSSWDVNWTSNYGGFDTPDTSARRNYIPIAFIPRQNPFYCALPYNDVAGGQFKPEAPLVIPWFKQEYAKRGSQPGISVCKDRWIEIRKGNRTCYAQWEDCGPFRNDHFQYVFGNERPKPNLNHGSGLNVSPAIRDYLGLAPTDVTDWQFVEVAEVPPGPWRSHGDNNHFVIARRFTEHFIAQQGKVLEKAAAQGDPNAQVDLAGLYQDGLGVPQDYKKAVALYEKAAAQGDALAQVNLGWMYREGKGVPKDYSKAVELYRKSADQGNAAGQAYLGSLYATGKGVPRNYQKALQLFHQAIDQESSEVAPNAFNDFAWFLATCPDNSQRNGKLAVTYATKACELTEWKKGNFIDTLAAAYAEAEDFDAAIKYQKQAMGIENQLDRAEMEKALRLYQNRRPYRESSN